MEREYLLKGARLKYLEALNYKTDDIELLAKIHSNLAYVELELKNFGKVIENCDKCIWYKNDFIKAYYRKAKSLMILKRYKESIECC